MAQRLLFPVDNNLISVLIGHKGQEYVGSLDLHFTGERRR